MWPFRRKPRRQRTPEQLIRLMKRLALREVQERERRYGRNDEARLAYHMLVRSLNDITKEPQ